MPNWFQYVSYNITMLFGVALAPEPKWGAVPLIAVCYVIGWYAAAALIKRL